MSDAVRNTKNCKFILMMIRSLSKVLTVTNANDKLIEDVASEKYCNAFEVGSSLIPKILIMMLPRVN